MIQDRSAPTTSMASAVAFSLLLLFFLQLLTDFVGAIYAFGLMGLNIPPEIASILVLFAPILLLVFKRPPGRRFLAGLAFLVIACRLAEPLLPTRERMLVSGLGTASFLLFLPLFLRLPRNEPQARAVFGLGSALGVGLAVLLRAAGSGIDFSTFGAGQALAWPTGLLAGFLLLGGLESDTLEGSNARTGPASFGRIVGLSLGLTGSLVLLYFGFAAPNVIARWTGLDLLPVLAPFCLALVGFALMIAGGPRTPNIQAPRVVLIWNLLFVVCLVLTLRLQQVHFPQGPEAYPLYAPAVPAWQLVPLGLTLMLWPVILLDFYRYSREISALRPSTRQLGGSFAISAVVLLLLIFGHVFTTVYDYIPLVGPLFRDRFWLVYLAAGLVMAAPLGLVAWERVDRASASLETRPAGLLRVLVGAAALGALLLAAFTSVRPGSPVQTDSSVRVMTFNIQQGYDAAGQKNFTAQLEVIRQLDPDLIGLQESDTNRVSGSNDDIVRYLANALGMYSYYSPSPVVGTFGLALLSKEPIEDPRTFYMYSTGEQTASITARITRAGKSFNILVTHLGNGGPMVQQEAVLTDLTAKSDLIAMGDFNFSADKPQYPRTLRILEDAWLLRWPDGIDDAGINPLGRIDHVFVSPGTRVSDARYLETDASDHPALLVEIDW